MSTIQRLESCAVLLSCSKQSGCQQLRLVDQWAYQSLASYSAFCFQWLAADSLLEPVASNGRPLKKPWARHVDDPVLVTRTDIN